MDKAPSLDTSMKDFQNIAPSMSSNIAKSPKKLRMFSWHKAIIYLFILGFYVVRNRLNSSLRQNYRNSSSNSEKVLPRKVYKEGQMK